MRIDISLLPALGAAFMLIFARVGMMLMLLPALGEVSISARARLTVALLLTAVLLPLHRNAYHVDLNSLSALIQMFGRELLIGAILGLTARIAMAALQVAGSVIAQQLGLGFVTAIDPTQAEQGVIVGNFLSILGVTLIFATNMHYLLIAALDDSYTLFAPGSVPLMGDAAALTTQSVASAFKIGVQLSAPFLVFGLLFNMGLGVLSRLMPQMQVYFIGLPLSIMIGLLILVAVLGAMMATFLGSMADVLHQLAPHG